jgi:hypothetical protein
MTDEPLVPPAFQTVAEIEAVVRAFEACAVAPEEFSHRAHLTVALWYLTLAPMNEATERMRSGLQRFIAHHGRQGYHETITLFWLKLVRHFLDQADANRPLPDLANELFARFGNSQFLFAHYSRELVHTATAKTTWVAPDLRPLEF